MWRMRIIEDLPAIFAWSTHCMWGRRFRLPTPYVLPQKASALASRDLGGNFSICYLAFGGLHPADSTAGVGRRGTLWVRLPHFICGPIRSRLGPRGGQSGVRAGLAAGPTDSSRGGRRPPAWRERKTVLSAPGLGDHAQPCARAAAAQDFNAGDYALGERLYGATGQPGSGANGRGILAR